MWADLIIELIQDLVHSVLPTLLNTNGQLPAINSTNDTIAAANDTTHTLPLPLFPGNGVSFNKCFRTFDFKPFVVDASGFNWTDEGRGKWGFVATAPGSELTLQASTLQGSHSPAVCGLRSVFLITKSPPWHNARLCIRPRQL